MIIGARTAAWAQSGGSGEWTNPYITDGLVAMWDGEWNAGGGVHNSSATLWKDLVGTRNLVTSYDGLPPIFSEKSVFFDGQNRTLSCDNPIKNLDSCTIEVSISSGAADGWYLTMRGSGDGEWLQVCTYQGYNTIYFNSYYFDNYNLSIAPSDFTVSYEFNVENENKKTDLTAYHNGALVQTFEFLSKEPNYIPGRLQNVLAVGSGKPWGNFFATGDVHSIRVYNRALTASEIAVNYAVDKARFNLA